MLMTCAPAPPSAFDAASAIIPAITDEFRQLPAALHTFAPTRWASGATPGRTLLSLWSTAPTLSPAMMPDTCVPWPLSSTPGDGEHAPASSETSVGTTVMQLTNEST